MKGITFYGPVVMVRNIQVSAKFYQRMLDQKIKHDFGNNIAFDSGLSLWEINAELPIAQYLKGRLGTKSADTKFELCFETDDIISAYKRAILLNLKFLHKLIIEPWGQKTYRFFDPDNNLVEVGETLYGFVSRMHESGMNNQEITEKTGIPTNTVLELLY